MSPSSAAELARSSTVLGVGVIAAVGAGGIATAQPGKPLVSLSLSDLSDLPNISSAFDSEDEPEGSPTPLSDAGLTSVDAEQGADDAGEALRARILQQAEAQKDAVAAAEAAAVASAAKAAAAEVAAAEAAAEKAAAERAAKERKEAEAEAAAAKKEAEEEARERAREKAEAERREWLAKQYTLPTSSYTLTSLFGQAGVYWASGYHTGLDFAAPSGTLIKAVHSGTITQAGYEGSYGYKTVLTLDDGTEIWHAHQSSIGVRVGQKVATGDVIGRVGATGNVTGAHLHLEIHPSGSSSGIDPMAWLRSKGLNP